MSLDLNKALIDMYKQRKQQIQPRKKPKVEEVAKRHEYLPKATFDCLFGCEANRNQIIRIVRYFTKTIEGQSIKVGAPILILGSKGLGKTSIVEAAANHAKLPLIPLFFQDLCLKTKNELQIHLEMVYEQCLSMQPAIILMDDIDMLNEEKDKIRLVVRILKRILKEELNLLIFCTSSTVLDDNFNLEFSSTIQLKRPDATARFNILDSLIKKYPSSHKLDQNAIKTIALDTPSFTPFNLSNLLVNAAEESEDLVITFEHCKTAISNIKQSFEPGTHLVGEKPTTTWEDIGGISEVRDAFLKILKEIKTGEADCQFASIALYGPPGCGKTMIAKAMANEAGFNFISIKPTELLNKFLGETERNIRKVFREAREYEPCIIYFDEFDGLCGSRGTRDNMTSAIQTLLSEMDGFASRGKSIVLISTNRLQDIDVAMKRPGRLSRHIEVKKPCEKARQDILEVYIKKNRLVKSEEVDLAYWATKTKGFSGADLAFLINQAKLNSKDTNKILEQSHLETAFDSIILQMKKCTKKTRKHSDFK